MEAIATPKAHAFASDIRHNNGHGDVLVALAYALAVPVVRNILLALGHHIVVLNVALSCILVSGNLLLGSLLAGIAHPCIATPCSLLADIAPHIGLPDTLLADTVSLEGCVEGIVLLF
jgi:hypothetical protein